MGAEVGATTSVFPFTERMADYLVATDRQSIAKFSRMYAVDLCADPGAKYDQVIHIHLNDLEPHINGPYSPDVATPISQFKEKVRENNWPAKISVGLIGSCTNGSYEDMCRSASVARNALDKNLKARCQLKITPGSERVHTTVERDGQLRSLRNAGGTVLANACGPCIGNWHRLDVVKGESNSIISSYNRNFAGRNDGNAATHSFVASPEIVMAMSLAGDLCFNPITDFLQNERGEMVRLEPPKGSSLPLNGYQAGCDGYQEPPATKEEITVLISPTSQRLQPLPVFSSWNGCDELNMPILIKTRGKTTTDDISSKPYSNSAWYEGTDNNQWQALGSNIAAISIRSPTTCSLELPTA